MSQPDYPCAAAPAVRQVSNHGTGSALSSSANPGEDWTRISDLAERRRIQNRIAQRNYRKKLKRRLEDLERRAGSSSASPPHVPAEMARTEQRAAQPVRPYKKNPPVVKRQPISPPMIPSQYTPPMANDDDVMGPQGFDRDDSRSPPLFAYQTDPAPEEMAYPPFPQHQPFRPWSMAVVDRDAYSDFLEPMPVTRPSMQVPDAIKREEGTMSPYSMTYSGLPSIDYLGHPAYDEGPHTPPLSHSYEQSYCTEPGFGYPNTPLSMPPSPLLMTQL